MVRANYDTLTLKLQDGLDQYERYSEQHKEAAFFKELVSAPPRALPVSQGGPVLDTAVSVYLGCSSSFLETNKSGGRGCMQLLSQRILE